MENVIIVGSGCAGLTAAIYAARANLSPLVIEGWEAGGQLTLTTMVENYPGFPDGIMGPDLILKMKEQAARFGAKYKSGSVTAAGLKQRPFRLTVEDEQIETKALILANGASARMLGLDSEKQLMGHGVSTCATCDGYFYRGRKVVVVGGGDSAMEESNFLTKFATEVALVHRRDQFRASKIMIDRAKANEKIKFITNTVVEDIHDRSKGTVTGVTLRNVQSDKVDELQTDGVFIAIGHRPNTEVFQGQIELDADGYIATRDQVETNIEGVFAAGDVQDRKWRQAVTAAGSGCMAAMDAERFLESQAN
ncbi:MAG: thioredoxin-disulfide reductase [Gammaproteobacteria bacterium]